MTKELINDLEDVVKFYYYLCDRTAFYTNEQELLARLQVVAKQYMCNLLEQCEFELQNIKEAANIKQ